MERLRERNVQRLIFFFTSVLLILALIYANIVPVGASAVEYDSFESQAEIPASEREKLAPPRKGITVVTDHSEGNIVALNPNGTLLYHNDTHDGYWDVDPSPEGSRTVLYSATDEITNSSVCKPVDDQDYCIEQMIK
jgi:hypothetical protein